MFNREGGEIGFGRFAKRAAGSGEPHLADGTGWLAIEALENRGVFAVHGEDTDAVFSRFAHDGFAGHDENFFGGDGDVFLAKVVSLCALNTVNRTVTICSPGNGSTVKSPVRIIAGTTDVTPVKLTQVYLDGKKIYETRLSAINVGLPIAAGTHRLTVQGLDTAKVFFKKSISINVSPH